MHCYSGVAAINQYIYVVGGFDGTRQLATVERYDTDNETWDMVAPIQIARSALSLTQLDGKLYAIGGFDGNNFLSIVEVYDPRTNTWEQGTPLNSGRSGHASAVIYQPSCASTFMDYEENEAPRRDDQNSDHMQSDFQQDPCSSRNINFDGMSSNMQFHASYGAGGCHNCDSEVTVQSEPQTEWNTRTIIRNNMKISNRQRRSRDAPDDLTDRDRSVWRTTRSPFSVPKQTIKEEEEDDEVEEDANSLSLDNAVPIQKIAPRKQCILTPVCNAMQNMIDRGKEWRYKKFTTGS